MNVRKGPTTMYLRMQDWADADRPREKLVQKGSAALTDAELLGILIGSGCENMSAVTLAQLVLKHHDNDLNTVARRSVKDLQQFRGIGEAKAVTILSALELSKRRITCGTRPKPKLQDSQSVYEQMKIELWDKTTEECWVVLLNRSNHLIKKQLISIGGISKTLVDPKVVFKVAIENNASGVILVHNHPSGNPNPSAGDMEVTKRLIKGGEALDITVLDHIIFAGPTYFSFVDDSLLFCNMSDTSQEYYGKTHFRISG
ncbi:MAG: DNA repair protein RadC [Bacteroidota bacterium]